MGNLHLVTGYAGQPHVTAADIGSLFETLIRNGQFVMASGSNLGAELITNNQVRISDGELLIQGRHVKLNPGTYVDVTIENGEVGRLRHDLIAVRYSRDAETGIEDCNLVAIKGTSAERDPADPEYITGNINAGDTNLHNMPLYRVVLAGLNVESIQPLFVPQMALFDSIAENFLPDELAKKLCPDIADPTPADAFAALLPLSGGSMTGPLTPEVIILTEGVNYGDTLPEPGTPGRLFFLKA